MAWFRNVLPDLVNLKKELKRYSRPITYGAARWGFLFFAALAKHLSLGTMISLFETIAVFTHACNRRHRSQMLHNLKLALGDSLEEDGRADEIIRRAVRNLHRGAAELASAVHWTPDVVKESILLEGRENLELALARGRGAIALSGHLGNFALIGTRLAAEGYAFNALIKNPPDRKFAELLTSLRSQIGQKTISARPRVEAAKQILKALRRNEIVLMVPDEYKHKGAAVEFFGRPAPSARGPATLALRSGAAVLPMFLLWEKQGLRLTIERPLELVETGQTRKDILENTAMFASCLERVIRRYPDQWNWLNVRWRQTEETV
jgi:KDO2-lipid IV(A) lauroyltransferase